MNGNSNSIETIKEIIEYLDSTKSEKPTIMSERDIKMGIMKVKKCNLVKAKEIFEEIKNDGLELFLTLFISSDIMNNHGNTYNITEYGILREYLNSDAIE